MKLLTRIEEMPFINTTAYSTDDVCQLMVDMYDYAWKATADLQYLEEHVPRGVIMLHRSQTDAIDVDWPRVYRQGGGYVLISLPKPGKMSDSLMEVLASTQEGACIPHSKFVRLAALLLSNMPLGTHRYDVFNSVNVASTDRWGVSEEALACVPYVKYGRLRYVKRPAGAEDAEAFIRAFMRRDKYTTDHEGKTHELNKLRQTVVEFERYIEKRQGQISELGEKIEVLQPKVEKHMSGFADVLKGILHTEVKDG